MRFYEFLNESKTLKLKDNISKEKFKEEVWSILDKSYSSIGGFKSYDNPDHMVRDSALWLITEDGGSVKAAIIFKDLHGLKLVGLGTDGSSEGKEDSKRLLLILKRMRNFWAEVSGPLEKMFVKMGIPYIQNEQAERMTGKQILELDNDRIHYIRYIAGQPIRKALMGYSGV